MRRDGFYHSAFGLQKPNRTLLNNNDKFEISTILPPIFSISITSIAVTLSNHAYFSIY